MKVIGVLGSPRGKASQTARLARALDAGLCEAGAETEWIDVCSLRVEYCRACDACHSGGRCVHHDDFEPLREKLLLADGIVLSSPDYFGSVTAQIKAAIDRLSAVIHCQLFRHKYACTVATAGGPSGSEVTAYLGEVLLNMGAYVVGGVAASMSGGPAAMEEAERTARALGREMASAMATRRVYPDQQERHRRTADYFRALVERYRNRWPHEAAFWATVVAAASGPARPAAGAESVRSGKG